MNEHETRTLLSLLAQYVSEYAPDIPTTLEGIASDLYQSLGWGDTTDLANLNKVKALT